MEPISFIKYDTISDKLMWLSQYHSLNMNVKLASENKRTGNRISMLKGYSYNSRYTDEDIAYSMKRSFDYYLTIENVTKTVYIQIRIQNMVMLVHIMNNIIKLLSDNSLWIGKNGQLQFASGYTPEYLNNLSMNKWLSFECVSMLYPNEEYGRGVRITLSNYNEYVDVSMDTFMAMFYLINNLDMATYAATIINFLTSPDVRGINIKNMNEESNKKAENQHSNSVMNKSFFS